MQKQLTAHFVKNKEYVCININELKLRSNILKSQIINKLFTIIKLKDRKNFINCQFTKFKNSHKIF